MQIEKPPNKKATGDNNNDDYFFMSLEITFAISYKYKVHYN